MDLYSAFLHYNKCKFKLSINNFCYDSDVQYWEYNFMPMNRVFDNFRKCKSKRRSLVECRINLMLILGDCVFLTLTFDDNYLGSLSYASKHQLVHRYLKSQSDFYLANVDYGSEGVLYVDDDGNERLTTGRIHYHAILLLSDKLVDLKSWKYGAISIERINGFDSDRISNYITKLTSHAVKDSTYNARIIYSKALKKLK